MTSHSRPLGVDAVATEYRRLSEPAYHGSFISRHDDLRPEPPAELIAVLGALAPATPPRLVVDLGSGTGISTSVWSAHADRVLGIAADAAHNMPEPMVLAGRAENHIRGVDDLGDTISRLIAYRDAGANVVYAPGLSSIGQVAAVADAVGAPMNVLALPNGPTLSELASAGVRRVSTGSALAACAYQALMDAAHELLNEGTSHFAARRITRRALETAFS